MPAAPERSRKTLSMCGMGGDWVSDLSLAELKMRDGLHRVGMHVPMTTAQLSADGEFCGMEVKIEPLGEIVDVEDGEALMQAAQRSGLMWPTACQGNATCGFCYVEVLSGLETLPPPSNRETKALRNVPPHRRNARTRLACQIRPMTPLVVRRDGVERNN